MLVFALPVVRRPGPGIATLFAGGYVASGTGTRDRLPGRTCRSASPSPASRAPARSRRRCAGPAADRLRPGDRVWLRHPKAGELAERFTRYQVLEGDQVTAVPTYRGEGQCFG